MFSARALCFDLFPRTVPSWDLLVALRLLHLEGPDVVDGGVSNDTDLQYKSWHEMIDGKRDIISERNEEHVQSSLRKMALALRAGSKRLQDDLEVTLSLLPSDVRHELSPLVLSIKGLLKQQELQYMSSDSSCRS